MSQKLKILARAKEILEPQGCWIQDALAMSKDGEIISKATSEKFDNATCYCFEGAIRKAIKEHSGLMFLMPFEKLFHRTVYGERMTGSYMHQWNDRPERTKEEVLDCLEQMITLVRIDELTRS